MAERSLIPDDLLRQIISVGQADVLVGVPTHDHGEHVGELVRAVRGCFRTTFPRRRAALLVVDLGSSDATPLAVEQVWSQGTTSADGPGLRTMHCMTTTIPAVVEGGGATQMILAAADLLQVASVAVLDADIQGVTAASIAALLEPVDGQAIDLVAPAYRRHAAEGLLVTQLLRPIVQATFGWRLHEPLLQEFGASGRLAAQCTQVSAASGHAPRETNFWIAAEALTRGFGVREAARGPRLVIEGRVPRSLPELFPHVIGEAFVSIDTHAASWLTRTDVEDVPSVRGWTGEDSAGAARQDGLRLLERFEHDVRNLDEILKRIVTPETFAAIVAASTDSGGPRYPDALWADTLAEFLAAYHAATMRREHIVRALLPLYLARTGAFLQACGDDTPDGVDAAAEELTACLVRIKPRMVERWNARQGVAHG